MGYTARQRGELVSSFAAVVVVLGLSITVVVTGTTLPFGAGLFPMAAGTIGTALGAVALVDQAVRVRKKTHIALTGDYAEEGIAESAPIGAILRFCLILAGFVAGTILGGPTFGIPVVAGVVALVMRGRILLVLLMVGVLLLYTRVLLVEVFEIPLQPGIFF